MSYNIYVPKAPKQILFKFWHFMVLHKGQKGKKQKLTYELVLENGLQ